MANSDISDPLLRLLEDARHAPSLEALHRLDDSVLTEFLMEHMREWVSALEGRAVGTTAETLSGIPPWDIEDCAGQISTSLLMRINDPSDADGKSSPTSGRGASL